MPQERKVKPKAKIIEVGANAQPGTGVIPAKATPDFRFLPAFAGFPRFIDAAPLSRADFLPPDPAHHFPLEGKTRKAGI